LSADEMLGLLNMELPCDLNVRYTIIRVPPIPRIFTTNRNPLDIFPPGDTPEQTAGLAARYRVMNVTGRLWG